MPEYSKLSYKDNCVLRFTFQDLGEEPCIPETGRVFGLFAIPHIGLYSSLLFYELENGIIYDKVRNEQCLSNSLKLP
jgi:hypothetical protein